MKSGSKIFRLLLILTFFLNSFFNPISKTIPKAHAVITDFYAAPNGKSDGDGSSGNPWDLQTAFNKTSTVTSGCTLWLRGGVYTHTPQGVTAGGEGTIFSCALQGTSTSPIKIRSYTGEWAKIDGGAYSGVVNGVDWGFHANTRATITVNGDYVWFMDMEIFSSSNESRQASDDTSFPPSISRSDGPYVHGEGVKFINMVFHDLTAGISAWADSWDFEAYGNLGFNNGFQGSVHTHGHNVYTQNDNATRPKVFRDNIFINPFDRNTQVYGSGSTNLLGYNLDNNSYINGDLTVGGKGCPVQNIKVQNNLTYNGSLSVMYHGGPYKDLLAANNIVVGRIQCAFWQVADIVNNTIITLNGGILDDIQDFWTDPSTNITTQYPFSQWNWNNNTYYGGLNSKNFIIEGERFSDFSEWKTRTGFDSSSTYNFQLPTTNRIFVRPNQYDNNRANIIIYNWQNLPSVTVDTSALAAKGWKNGDTYELRSVQDYFVDRVVGTYNGSSINVNMSAPAHSIAIPKGWSVALGPNTFPQFGAFILVNTTGAPPPAQDTTPPSTPLNLQGSAVSPTQINLTWDLSSDNVGVTGYKIFRNGNQIGTSNTNSFQSTGLLASTAYSFNVLAYDGAGNNSGQSTVFKITTPSATNTSITITSPANNSTFTAPANFALSANATSGVAISKVEFFAGTTLLTTDISSPYSFIWNNIPAGTYNLIAKVTDVSNKTASASVNVTVNSPLTMTTGSPLQGGTIGVAYSQTLAVTGGLAPYIWAVTAGNLPNGLKLNAQGVTQGIISGTPTSVGSFNFTTQVTDSTGAKITKSFGLVIGGSLSIVSTSPLSPGTVGISYSKNLIASGGTAPLSWTVISGSLPNGLSLSNAGVLTGTPLSSGNFGFTIQITDNVGATTSKSFSLIVNSALSFLTTALANGTAGSAYSQTLLASGGTAPLTWSKSSGTLPVGLTLNSASGVLSGTLLSAGTFNFTIKAQDSAGATVTQTFTVVITAPTSLNINNPADLPDGTLSAPYNQSLFASGGTGSYTWSLPSGSSLPPGLTLSASGNITGTPTSRIQNGVGFNIKLVDSANTTLTKLFFLFINILPNISSRNLPNGLPGEDYSDLNNTQTILLVNGGTPPYTWSILSGSLPTGMTLNPLTAEIDGTPNATGIFPFTVQATDSTGAKATNQFSLTIGGPLVITTGATLADASTGNDYLQTLNGAGGISPYYWSLQTGSSLPPGLNLDPSGFILGKPTTTGLFTVAIQLTDQGGSTFITIFSIQVKSSFSITVPSALPDAPLGNYYVQFLGASGGMTPYSWTVLSGTLPSGIVLDITGVLTGTPTKSGVSNFSVNVRDINGVSASQTFTLVTGNPTQQSGTQYSQVVNPNNNELVSIPCQIDVPTHITIEIYSHMNDMVTTVMDTNMPAGDCHADWNGKNKDGQNVASGLYLGLVKKNGKSDGHFHKVVVVK